MSTRVLTVFVAGIVIVAWIAVALAGCGRAHRGEPQAPEVRPDNPTEARGERLFGRFCFQCHPGGAGGLGPALNDKPLPETAIRTQIRKGVGAMPAFGDDMLTDEEVEAIAEYVEELRGTPSAFPAEVKRPE